MKVKLGEKYTDKFTRFTGVAMARTEYLYGCTSIGLLPLKLNEEKGTPSNWVWIDEQRLVEDSPAKAGGLQPTPPQR